MHTNTFCEYRKNYAHRLACILFGIAIVSSRNRVFFRMFLYFESIHRNSVRHSKIIHISGIRQRKILCFTSLFLSRCTVFRCKYIFPQKYFFRGVISLHSDKSGVVLLPWRKHFWSLSNNLIIILNSANWSVLSRA